MTVKKVGPPGEEKVQDLHRPTEAGKHQTRPLSPVAGVDVEAGVGGDDAGPGLPVPLEDPGDHAGVPLQAAGQEYLRGPGHRSHVTTQYSQAFLISTERQVALC